ncbi:MAG: ATP-binding protein [Stigonema ocellatum SAG 48.90 = DSM 106950]|nr:ATP-binding protein [Stigonema ocellatum SAG 48.90 = DSM 106950]
MESLTVSKTLDSLQTIAKYIKEAAIVAGLDKKASYNLRLAVEEIATNIILYGYQETGCEGVIDLRVSIDEQALTLFIEDTSEAFDPFLKLNVALEQIHLPIEQRPIGGLGLYLAIHGVDKFLYERTGNRNRNILVVNLPKQL